MLQQFSADVFIKSQRIDEIYRVVHLRYLEQIVGIDRLERLGCKRYHLEYAVSVYPSHIFETHLVDLLEAVVLAVFSVNVLYVVKLLAFLSRRARIVDDAERHVRLHRQQSSVKVCKGQHLVAYQKVPVRRIKRVFLEFAYLVFFISEFLEKSSELQRGSFIRSEIVFHIRFPFALSH